MYGRRGIHREGRDESRAAALSAETMRRMMVRRRPPWLRRLAATCGCDASSQHVPAAPSPQYECRAKCDPLHLLRRGRRRDMLRRGVAATDGGTLARDSTATASFRVSLRPLQKAGSPGSGKHSPRISRMARMVCRGKFFHPCPSVPSVVHSSRHPWNCAEVSDCI